MKPNLCPSDGELVDLTTFPMQGYNDYILYTFHLPSFKTAQFVSEAHAQTRCLAQETTQDIEICCCCDAVT